MNPMAWWRMLPMTAALVAAFPAAAQNLLELYEAARAHDPVWQSARARYEANLYRAEQARAGILPQADLAAGAAHNRFESDSPPADRSFSNRSARLSASQPLYRPGEWATYEQGKLQVQLARSQLDTAAQDLILRVSQAYFDVLAAQDTLAFLRAQKTAVGEQLGSVKRSFEVGTTTITDTREAQARFDLVAAQEIAAENDLRVRKLALDTLVGRTDAQPRPLATPLAVPTPQPADVNAWVNDAETTSPAIQLARANLDIAALEIDKARAGHKPTVDLVASYDVNRNPNAGIVGLAPQQNRTHNTQVGVTFRLPLFAGFATQNRIRESLSLEERARADLEAARRDVAQATRSAYFGVVSGQSQVRALEAAEASSQSALDANRTSFQAGVRINIDVLNAQSQLFQTKRDLAQARYNVLLGLLRLRQANGTLTADELVRLNALLRP